MTSNESEAARKISLSLQVISYLGISSPYLGYWNTTNFSSNLVFINAVVYVHIITEILKVRLLSNPYSRSHHGSTWLLSFCCWLAHLKLELLSLTSIYSFPTSCCGFTLVTRSSHPTLLASKGIHHLSSQSSLPLLVNTAMVVPKKEFLKNWNPSFTYSHQTNPLPPFTDNLRAFHIVFSSYSGSP